jgi:ribosome-binding factor A
MPDKRRLERLENQILQTVGPLISHGLADPRLELVTVTRIRLAPDLSVARVNWSSMGDPKERSKAGHALEHARGHLQSAVARSMRTRTTPRLEFHYDESIEKAARVNEILNDIARERVERNQGVRAATADDLDSIHELYARWVEDDSAFGLVAPERSTLDAWLDGYCFVADTTEGPVGFAYGQRGVSEGNAVLEKGEAFVEVTDLYVLPTARGEGLGGKLLDAVIVAAEADGIAAFHAFSGSRAQGAVLDFYEKHGFRPWGIQFFRGPAKP